MSGSCNCGTWACRVDTLLHLLHIRLASVCDRHEAQILGMSWDMWQDWNDPDSPWWIAFDEREGVWRRWSRTNSTHPTMAFHCDWGTR